MPIICRYAIHGAGARKARFSGHLVDLRKPNGRPSLAVMHRLINGGGKSSNIQILSGIFEPDATRLRTPSRQFIELFTEDAVGIVAVETTIDGAHPTLFADDTPRQVFGYAAQKKKVVGTKSKKDGYRIERIFFHYTCTDGVDITSLPIRRGDAAVRRPGDVRDILMQMAEQHPAARPHVEETQSGWRDYLEDLLNIHLDALIEMMMLLNKLESGNTGSILQRFTSDAEFLDFLLTPIVAKTATESLSGSVGETIKKAAALERRKRQADFYERSIPLLDEFAALAERKKALQRALDGAISSYALLGGGVDARLAARRVAFEAVSDEAERNRTDHVEAAKALDVARRRVNWLEIREAELLAAASAQRAASAGSASGEAENDLERGRALASAGKVADLDVQVAQIARLVEQQNQPLSEARAAMRETGGRLAALLDAAVGEARKSLQKAEEEHRKAGVEATDAEREQARLLQRQEYAKIALARVNEEVRRRAAEIDALVTSNHLSPGESPAEAEAAAQARLKELSREAERRATLLRKAETTATNAKHGLEQAGREAREAEAEAGRLAELRRAYDRRLSAVVDLPWLRRSFSAGVNPYAPETKTVLADKRQQIQVVAAKLVAASDAREAVIAAIDEHEVLPPPFEVQEVLRRLRERGVENAHWMPLYLLHAGWTPARIRAALAADPARHSGVVVLGQGADEIAGHAEALSHDSLTSGPVEVSAPPETLDETAAPRAVVQPSDAALDKEAAAVARGRLQNQVDDDLEEVGRLRQQSDEIQSDLDALSAFLHDHPPGWVEVRDAEIETARAAAETAAEEKLAAEDALFAADQAATDAERALGEAKTTLEREGERLAALSRHVARWVDRDLEEEQRVSEADLVTIAGEIAANDERCEAARLGLEGIIAALRLAEDRLRDLKLDRDGVSPDEMDAAAHPLSDDRIDVLRAEFSARREHVATFSVDAALEATLKSLRDRRRDMSREHGQGHPRHPLGAALTEIAAGTMPPTFQDLREMERNAKQALAASAKAARDAEADADALRNIRAQHHGETAPPEDADALKGIGDCQAVSAALQGQIARLEATLSRLAEGARDIGERSSTLKDDIKTCEGLLREIRGSLPDEAILPEVADPDMPTIALPDRERSLRGDIRAAERDLGEADRRLGRSFGRYYGDFLPKFRDEPACEETLAQITTWTREALEAHASTLLRDQRESLKVVRYEIDQAEDDMSRSVTAVDTAFGEVWDEIRLVPNRSKLPQGLGAWSGKSFIHMHEPTAAGLADVRLDRIRRWHTLAVKRLETGQDAIPATPSSLLKDIVKFVLDGLLRFDCIVPDSELRLEYDSCVVLQKYSGGEKLMATLLLFFLYVQMSAKKLGGSHGTSMFIFLDNPVGEMNAPGFVKTIREMGAKTGIQIVGWTGLNDMNALQFFSVCVSLRRRVTTGRTFVEAVEVSDLSRNDPESERSLDVARLITSEENEGDA